MKHGRKGFTLIELLVVIGIIAIMVGVLVGVLGGGGNSATSLQSAQSMMSSLLASARGQAALTGYNAALFVNDNPGTPAAPNDRYLRYCVIAVYKPDLNGQYGWFATNEGVYLPKGTYVVPPDAMSGGHVASGVNFTNINLNGFDGPKAVALNSATSENWFVLGVSPLGLRVDATNVTATANPAATAAGYIVLSTADPQPPGSPSPILFTNANNVRGMSISQYGVAGFINDASGFQ